MAPNLFILHASPDARYEEQLAKHLFLHHRVKKAISMVRERELVASGNQQKQLEDAIAAADIVVLLLSPDSLSACYELAVSAMEQKKRVVPVLVREVEWREADFGGLRPLPRNERPVERWTDPDSAWVDVVNGLRMVWESVAAQKSKAEAEAKQKAEAEAKQAVCAPPYQHQLQVLPVPPPPPLPAGSRIKVLFFSANPRDTGRININEELRQVKDRVMMATHRDRFEFIFEPEVRTNRISSVLMRHNPHIVHFSGHGEDTGAIVLADPDHNGQSQPVDPVALRDIFMELKDNIYCVVLNSCWSSAHQAQADALADAVGCVVGMSDAIKDKSAIEFAATFYETLAFGRSVKTAFNLAKANLGVVGATDANILRLTTRSNVDSSKLVMVSSG